MNLSVSLSGLRHLLVKRYMGPFWKRRKWLEETQWLSPNELQAVQLDLFKKLIWHAYKTVPYYKNLMDAEQIDPNKIESLEDIKKFPLQNNKIVLAAGDSIISTKYPRWAMSKGRTGGTTGTPLVTPRNPASIGNEHAFVRRQWDWAGIGFNDRTAYLSGRVIVDPDKKTGPFHAYDPFMKELILSTYHLSKKTAVDYIKTMQDYQVKGIVGYPASIYFLAKVCLDAGLDIKLRSALTTSETVSKEMRDTIEKAFHCQVFDFYGAAERVCYIFTCEKGSYHVNPEYGLSEFIPIDESEPNVCKLVATGFWNYGMPLIRYDANDVFTLSDRTCDCGRHFQVIDSIVGRTGDVIQTPSGRQYGPTLLARVSKGGNNILETQIVQDTIDHLWIHYVPSDSFTEQDLEEFKNHMRNHMPTELQLDYKCVDEIYKTKSGKKNLLVSELN